MSRSRRLLVSAAAVGAAALLVTGCVPPPPAVAPTPVSHAPGFAEGPFVPLRSYTVRVHPSAAALRADVAFAARRVSELSGVQLTIGPDSPAVDPVISAVTNNEIVVAVGRFCAATNEAGCATTWTLDGLVTHARLSTTAQIAADPDQRRGVLLHEFGHALGLAHFDHRFEGRVQAMSSVLDVSATDFRSGDAAGLIRQGSRSAATVPARNPRGAMDAVRVNAGAPASLTVTGWALDPDTASNAVRVEVKVSGRPAVTLWANHARSPAPSGGSTHNGFSHRVEVPSGVHQVCVKALNERFGTAATQLGCETVTVPIQRSGPPPLPVDPMAVPDTSRAPAPAPSVLAVPERHDAPVSLCGSDVSGHGHGPHAH